MSSFSKPSQVLAFIDSFSRQQSSSSGTLLRAVYGLAESVASPEINTTETPEGSSGRGDEKTTTARARWLELFVHPPAAAAAAAASTAVSSSSSPSTGPLLPLQTTLAPESGGALPERSILSSNSGIFNNAFHASSPTLLTFSSSSSSSPPHGNHLWSLVSTSTPAVAAEEEEEGQGGRRQQGDAVDQVSAFFLSHWLGVNPAATAALSMLIFPLATSLYSGALVVLLPAPPLATEFWSLENASTLGSPTHLLLQYTLTALASISFQSAKLQSDAMLRVAKSLLDTTGTIDELLKKTILEARSLMGADRCSFFLADKERNELWAKLFDVEAPVNLSPPAAAPFPFPAAPAQSAPAAAAAASSSLSASKGVVKIRFPITKGIAGHVYQSGKLLNISDAYAHPLFNREIDELTGFRTRSLLTLPVFNGAEVIGVIQAINKHPSFSADDERIACGFAVLVGLALRQSLLNEERFKAEHNAKVALEILSYHRQVKSSSVNVLVSSSESFDADDAFPGFTTLAFPPRIAVPLDETIKSSVYMLNELGVPSRWHVPKEVLVRFLLTVQLGYRDVPYHNWLHAFSVAHFSYVLAKRTNLKKYIGEDEIAALFISCLGHDIDHRGTTNKYG